VRLRFIGWPVTRGSYLPSGAMLGLPLGGGCPKLKRAGRSFFFFAILNLKILPKDQIDAIDRIKHRGADYRDFRQQINIRIMAFNCDRRER
jgi:hypothetical protein